MYDNNKKHTGPKRGGGAKQSYEIVNARREKILEIKMRNPDISATRIAEQVGSNITTVCRDLKYLRKQCNNRLRDKNDEVVENAIIQMDVLQRQGISHARGYDEKGQPRALKSAEKKKNIEHMAADCLNTAITAVNIQKRFCHDTFNKIKHGEYVPTSDVLAASKMGDMAFKIYSFLVGDNSNEDGGQNTAALAKEMRRLIDDGRGKTIHGVEIIEDEIIDINQNDANVKENDADESTNTDTSAGEQHSPPN